MSKKKVVIYGTIGIIIAIINIVFAIIFRGENGANIFTAISGWISGVATIFLGIIAVLQTKKYKMETDCSIEFQNQLFEKIRKENEQGNEMAYRQFEADKINRYEYQIDSFTDYLERNANSIDIKIRFIDYTSNRTYANFHLNLLQIYNDLQKKRIKISFIPLKNDLRDNLDKQIESYVNLIDELRCFEKRKLNGTRINEILEEMQIKHTDIYLSSLKYLNFLRQLRDKVMDFKIDVEEIKSEIKKYDVYKINQIRGEYSE